jgi:uncharacterized phage-like protein YoqJ
MAETKFNRQKNETDRKQQNLNELLSKIDQMDYEMQMAKKEFEVTNANNEYLIANLKKSLKLYDDRGLSVDEANMMIGEDFRSQAA